MLAVKSYCFIDYIFYITKIFVMFYRLQQVFDYQDLDSSDPCNTGIYKKNWLPGFFLNNSLQYHDLNSQ